MAKYNLDNYLEKDGLGFPLNFRRGNPNPLDNSSVWKSLSAAQNYAQTDPTAYVGQILSVVNYTPAVTDEEGNVTTASQSTVEVYYIKDEAGNLEAVGTSPVGDEKTVTVAEDGTVSLYGIEGLELTRTEDDGSTTNITYQPLYVNGKLTWVEPSATTVEGLAAEIEGLKTQIGTLEQTHATDKVAIEASITAAQTAFNALKASVGTVPEDKTVVQMIADAQTAATYDDTELAGRVSTIEGDYLKTEHKTALETAISEGDAQTLEDAKGYADGLNTSMNTRVTTIENDYLKSSDKTELSEAISDAEESAVNRVLGYLAEETVNADFDTLKEVAAWIESDTTASAELVTRVSNIEKDYLKNADKAELQGAIDDLEAFVGALPEGAVSTTVIAYIQEVVDGLKIGDYAKASDLTELAGRVTTLEGKMTEVEGDISDINLALDGKVDKVDGSRLMADTEGTKLEGIEEGAQVNKIETVDTAQFGLEDRNLTLLDVAMGKVTGLTDALAGKVDKVEGSRLLTEDEATKLEKLVLGENGEVSVSGKVAAGNVDGLEAWITQRAATLEGLSENNFTDSLLSKLEGISEGAQVNVIDGVSDEFTISTDGKVLNINAISMDKITGLSDELAGKVNAVDGMGLSSNDFTDDLLAKLTGIEEGAQVNYVKSVTEEFSVSDEGKLSVSSLNVNKLTQSDDEYLILNGGSSSL